MSKDTIYREDAIKTMEQRYEDILRIFKRKVKVGEKALALDLIGCVKTLPSADRPQGDVDAVAIFEREMHNLEQGYITIGEFDERIEPLRRLCYGRPQGEWIHDYHFGLALPEHKCSVCGEWEYSDSESNYCPHCGARMKGVDDDN